MKKDIIFTRLTEISLDEIAAHMSDPKIATHMPLLKPHWTIEHAADFVTEKEKFWEQDGLGHWAFLKNGLYVGWGGFQKIAEEWDFGLVLKPNHFGLGPEITRQAIIFAKNNQHIPFVTFLLPPSRTNLRAIERLGTIFIGEIIYEGASFMKYRLETPAE